VTLCLSNGTIGLAPDHHTPGETPPLRFPASICAKRMLQ
jgi:hypothetical protein